ncbi:hypothetical protein SSAG_06256 [Streptomyces sp. Mg1]|nr:hypothetical protein SSAG_06256 [Streptomyces sp. Mg1]
MVSRHTSSSVERGRVRLVGGEGAHAVRVRQCAHRATPPWPLPRRPLPTRPPSFAKVE